MSENNFVKIKVEDLEILEIPQIKDRRGNLSVVEGETIPFNIERVYYLYDVPSDSHRGGHAHKNLLQLLIPLSGSFEIVTQDGYGNSKVFMMNKPNKGLLLLPGIWREITNFSSGAVCLVLASQKYIEEDYIRDFEEFRLYKKSKSKTS